MLRRLALVPAAAIALVALATPASADYQVICVQYQEQLWTVTGRIFVDGPVPVLPNKVCFVNPLGMPIELPPIG